jgi:hypothetical protein
MTDITSTSPICPICFGQTIQCLVNQPEDYEYDVEIASEFQLYNCGNCASEYVWPRPNINQLKLMYPDTYYAYEQDMGKFWQYLYDNKCRAEAKKLLTLTTNRPIRLFDVGAGDCRHFNAIADIGDFTFSGVEMNPDMVAKARAQDFNITQGTIEEFDPSMHEGSVISSR